MRSRGRQGQSIIEFTFVGIPIIFVLISLFEISRGMWIYSTLAHAAREGVRFSIAHGENCYQNGNTCGVTIGDIASRIRYAGVGLDETVTNVTFTSTAGATSCLLNSCVSNATPWPPANAYQAGNQVSIQVVTQFRSAIVMFWPGSRPVSFGTMNLPASSSDNIQF